MNSHIFDAFYHVYLCNTIINMFKKANAIRPHQFVTFQTKKERREGEIILLILFLILEIKIMRRTITIKNKCIFSMNVILKSEP